MRMPSPRRPMKQAARDRLTLCRVHGHFRDTTGVHQRDPYIIFQIGEKRIQTEALKV